jgi:hypothetical protein
LLIIGLVVLGLLFRILLNFGESLCGLLIAAIGRILVKLIEYLLPTLAHPAELILQFIFSIVFLLGECV